MVMDNGSNVWDAVIEAFRSLVEEAYAQESPKVALVCSQLMDDLLNAQMDSIAS